MRRKNKHHMVNRGAMRASRIASAMEHVDDRFEPMQPIMVKGGTPLYPGAHGWVLELRREALMTVARVLLKRAGRRVILTLPCAHLSPVFGDRIA